MSRVFLGVGSNEGDRLANISRAARSLADTPSVQLVHMAPIYETAPVGGPEQRDFLNTILEIDTTLSPHALLQLLKDVERRLGRAPGGPQWGPRPIDLDILLYDDLVIREPNLVIPHERMHERRFVLEPLAQLAPDLRHPTIGATIAELLDHCSAPLARAPHSSTGSEAED